MAPDASGVIHGHFAFRDGVVELLGTRIRRVRLSWSSARFVWFVELVWLVWFVWLVVSQQTPARNRMVEGGVEAARFVQGGRR